MNVARKVVRTIQRSGALLIVCQNAWSRVRMAAAAPPDAAPVNESWRAEPRAPRGLSGLLYRFLDRWIRDVERGVKLLGGLLRGGAFADAGATRQYKGLMRASLGERHDGVNTGLHGYGGDVHLLSPFQSVGDGEHEGNKGGGA